MNRSMMRGINVLGLLLGSWGSVALAQGVAPRGTYPYPYGGQPGGFGATGAVPPPPVVPRTATTASAPGMPAGTPRPAPAVARYLQEPAPSMPAPTAAPEVPAEAAPGA